MLFSDGLLKWVFLPILSFFSHRRGICPWELRIAWYLLKQVLGRNFVGIKKMINSIMCKLSLGCSFLSLLINDVMWLVTSYVDRQTCPTVRRGNTTLSMVEIFCLIDCWSDDVIEADLSKTHRNRNVYEKMSYKMREHGYLCSWEACRTKIKSFRVQYLRVKEENNTSGQERIKFYISNTSPNSWAQYL